MEFFSNNLSLGVDTESPYSVAWLNVPTGAYNISAVATDNDGAEARSTVVNILVGSNICLAEPWDTRNIYVSGNTVSHNYKEWEAKWWTQGEEPGTTGEWGVWKQLGDCNGGGGDNQLPTVTITSPVDGRVYDEGQNVIIAADAADSDGSISQVEFFSDNQSLGVAGQSPYFIEWQDAPTGAHQLVAVATDNEGGETESMVVNIEVSGSGGGSCVGLPDYPVGIGSYQPGQQVQNNGDLYEVREFPYGGWTNINAPYFYEPGAGIAWENAWYYVGSCD